MLLTSIVSLNAVAEIPPSKKEVYSPLLVSGGFTKNNKPAFTIVFGDSSQNAFGLTMTCEQFRKMPLKSVTFEEKANSPVSLRYTSEDTKETFMPSENHNTFIRLQFTKHDFKKKQIAFYVDGMLLNINSMNKVAVPAYFVEFTKADFDNFKHDCK
ncbi:hypothetical protein [Actinobacillus lignieresii]|uniref:hypothetical protein n=1 Tax=Actinobacillus lignieresii TaxID=720 RepID=UPI000E204A75|nr:hypothetical protein [Actinobacillus lignieresii]